MLASRLVGTTERSMSSMCATQALSEVSLRSSTEANVLPPFTRHSLRVPYRWWGEDTRQGASDPSALHGYVRGDGPVVPSLFNGCRHPGTGHRDASQGAIQHRIGVGPGLCELPRTPLRRSSVNRGKKKGRSCYAPARLVSGASLTSRQSVAHGAQQPLVLALLLVSL